MRILVKVLIIATFAFSSIAPAVSDEASGGLRRVRGRCKKPDRLKRTATRSDSIGRRREGQRHAVCLFDVQACDLVRRVHAVCHEGAEIARPLATHHQLAVR